jgi:hypothetical protein
MPAMAETNTGPSTPLAPPAPTTDDTGQSNPAAPPSTTGGPDTPDSHGTTEIRKGTNGSSSGASGTSGPYNPAPNPGATPAPQ